MKQLPQLAALYGVETSFTDVSGVVRKAEPEGVLSILRALGAPLETERDISSAVAAHEAARRAQVIEPVHVSWSDEAPRFFLNPRRTPVQARWVIHPLTGGGASAEGVAHIEDRVGDISLPTDLPIGRYQLEIELAGCVHTATLLRAPRRLDRHRTERTWGVFAPTYALRTSADFGMGDLRSLGALVARVAELGGGVTSTLPLLSIFADEPSPYSPVSRLFWNEWFLDLRALPELRRGTAWQAAGHAQTLQVSGRELVDWSAQGRFRRELIATAARNSESDDVRRALSRDSELARYCAFRAEAESPTDERARASVMAYHAYAQLRMREQLSALRRDADAKRIDLYFDLPLGVHSSGYDATRFGHCFIRGASAGAPPDAVFAGGQDWSFHPPHPEGNRRDGYDYFSRCLATQLEVASMLRIDHVMSLHRVFCIPLGASASDGVYVRQHTDELYAALAIEAHLHGATIVGEDLGTVPPEVTRSMEEHGVLGLYVLQLEPSDPKRPMSRPSHRQVASANTHDLAPFAAFVQDRTQHERLQAWRDASVIGENEERPHTRAYEWLHDSEAPVVVYSLEDLAGATAPQNEPGSSAVNGTNWRRRVPLDAIHSMRDLSRVRKCREAVPSPT